jgi:hypothetical protein
MRRNWMERFRAAIRSALSGAPRLHIRFAEELSGNCGVSSLMP